jgi:DNA-directed RNA polymerase specialized sigma24 family protein
VLFRVALRLTGEYEDARDATQNAFVKAFEQLTGMTASASSSAGSTGLP